MSKFLRVIAIVMTICTLLTVFVGCKEDAEEPQTSETVAPIGDASSMIVADGQALYTLVYPKNPSGLILDAVDRFVEAVKEATGVELDTKSDEIRKTQVYNSSTPEILFGRTGYDETATALEELHKSQFTLRTVGKKIGRAHV